MPGWERQCVVRNGLTSWARRRCGGERREDMPTGDPTNLAQLGIHWGDRQATIEKDSLCEGNAQGMSTSHGLPHPPSKEPQPWRSHPTYR